MNIMSLNVGSMTASQTFYAAGAVYFVFVIFIEGSTPASQASFLQTELLSWCMIYGIIKTQEFMVGGQKKENAPERISGAPNEEVLALLLVLASILPTLGRVSWATVAQLKGLLVKYAF